MGALRQFQKFYQAFQVLLLALLLLGTSFYPQPFPETVQGAPIIVRGKIGMNYSDWGKDLEGSKRIYTYFEFSPSEVLKGALGGSSTVTIREMGGQKDGVALTIDGTSKFSRGEDVVVFLNEKNNEGSYDVHGMMMGKLNIETDSESQDYLTGPAITIGRPDQAPKRWTLADLRELIQSQGSAQKDPSPPTPKALSVSTPSPLNDTPTNTPAPQLQPSSPDENQDDGNRSKNFSFLSVVVALGVLGIIGFFGFLRHKK